MRLKKTRMTVHLRAFLVKLGGLKTANWEHCALIRGVLLTGNVRGKMGGENI